MKQYLYKKVFTISLMHINTFKQVLFSMLKNLKYLHTHMDVLGTTSVTCPFNTQTGKNQELIHQSID